jgi:hypothetical protein
MFPLNHQEDFMPLIKRLSLFLLPIALLPVSASTAGTLNLEPFSTTNQNPLVAIYGLPAAGSAFVLAPGRTVAELRADIASNYSDDNKASESILLDGETYRFTLAMKHGVSENLEVGLEVPYVMHRGGFLDSFIIDWHDFFHLPQGGRDDAPRDRLAYRYEKDGQTLIDLDDQSEGLGDVRLTGAWQLWQREGEEPQSLALRASLKLPTGDDDQLLGSGSTDLALWLSGAQSFRSGSLSLFGAAGTLLMSEGDVLADQQRDVVAFGTLGAGWQPLTRLALKVQMDGHTAFYKETDLTQLSGSVQLAIGGTVGLTDSLALDIAVTEDIVVDSASDVVFHLALRQAF